MTDTAPAFPPCSDCSEGNHGPCSRPFCGCQQAGHTLGPAVAPIGEVLDAATRAPASAEAAAQAEVEAQPAPSAPVVPAAADPLAMVDPAAVGAQLAESLAPVLDPPPPGMLAPLGPSDEDTLPTQDFYGGAQAPDEPPAPNYASESQRVTYDPQAALLAMAAPRDPSLHVSIWDGPRADRSDPAAELAKRTPPPEDEAALLAAMEADLLATGNGDAINLPEHAYAGTPDAPYLCFCGKDPGSLNKLASHLGIVGDADATAELGKLTVPNVVANKARARMAEAGPETQALPPADDTEKTSPGTGEPTTEVAQLTDEAGAPVDVVVSVEPPVNPADDPAFRSALRDAMAEDPAMVDVLIEANAAELAAQGALTPDPTAPIETTASETLPGYLPPLGPSEELDEPQEVTHGFVTPDELPAPVVQVTQIDHLATLDSATIAELLQDAIAQYGPTTSMGGLDDAPLSPFRILVVNGAQGWVAEALYGGDPIHPTVADEILEHFGFDPTPLAALPLGTPAELEAAVRSPQPTEAPPETRSMSVLTSARADAPTRVQVARLTTSCAECTVPIEPGDLIGFKAGLGTVHATHGG